MKKKNIKECVDCKWFKGSNCTHKTNLGIEIKYRIEKPVLLKSVEELNQNKDCENHHAKT